MRKYDVAYVPNGPVNYYPSIPLEDMSLEEIKKKYIKTCGKANGNVSECSKCTSPCKEGKRAIQLLANEVYNDPPIPLYGGKTLIERAREENMKRRQQEEKKDLATAIEEAKKAGNPVIDGAEKKKRNYILWEGWWESSLESGDQVKWLMENMKLSRTQAKKKIYQYKWTHGMAGTEKKEEVIQNVAKENVEYVDNNIESKLEKLMKQQEEYKNEMDKYMKLFNEAKEKYLEIKNKTDTLCNAMDILNE